MGTTVPAVMGPCAPNKPVLHSSCFADASEHAAISGSVETRIECAVFLSARLLHVAWSQPFVGTQYAHVGFLGVEFSMPSKQVFSLLVLRSQMNM